MASERISASGDQQSPRHTVVDWLALHELDVASCRGLLKAIGPTAAPSAPEQPTAKHHIADIAVAWRTVVAAAQEFMPERRDFIDDVFRNTTKTVVDRKDDSRKALTLDNGPGTYPTILFSYRGDAADLMVMAHEFAHALQLRASEGRFTPPVMREVCAFLGEAGLLAHALRHAAAQHFELAAISRRESARYFGVQSDRLAQALSQPTAPYRYSWNYPVARILATRIFDKWSRDQIWSVFKGQVSVRDALLDLSW